MTAIADLRQRLRALGAAPLHEAHVLRRWLAAKPLDGGKHAPEHFLPRPLRDALPAIAAEWDSLARIASEHPAPDGSARLLVTLADGQTVESVRLPRDGLCVSSQLGCAVGCTFCMTGTGGLVRQLGSAEIAAQVALARRARPVKKVVFMGMGEPAHNLDAVLDAIDLLGHEGGIGHKQLVFSTVGDPRVFERLGTGRVKPALALSLHTTDAALRERLLPRAPRFEPRALVDAAVAYAEATGYPLQLQWTLLAGTNDGDADLLALAVWLRGRPAMVNLIPYNEVDGLPWQRPDWERAAELARLMNRHGVLTRLRRSAGQEVDGGCGQLRARIVLRSVPVPRAPRAAVQPAPPA